MSKTSVRWYCLATLGTALVLLPVLWSTTAAQVTPDFLLQRMDIDGDGRISANEFIGRRKPFGFFDRDYDGYATREELVGARKVLNAAALTYLAAFLASLMTLLYWALRLGLLGGRRD